MIRKKRIGGGSHPGGQLAPGVYSSTTEAPGRIRRDPVFDLPHRPPEPFRYQRQSAIWRRMLAPPFLGNTVPRSHGDNSCPEDQVQKSGDKQKPFEDLTHNEDQNRTI